MWSVDSDPSETDFCCWIQPKDGMTENCLKKLWKISTYNGTLRQGSKVKVLSLYLEFVLKILSRSEFVSYIFSLCRLRIQMFPPDSDEVVQKASLPYFILYNIASWTVYILVLPHYTDVETFHNILFLWHFSCCLIA